MSAQDAEAERFDLSGKVALVTGGSRGLGREIVLAFARAGADVIISSRSMDSCVHVAKEVESTTSQRALPVACHVGRWDDVGHLVDAAYSEFPKIDVLVNNAGLSPLYGKLSEISEELYDKVFNVNAKGAFRLCALVGERMVDDGGGSIINVSSYGSLSPQPYFLPYAAAKAALNAFTVGFARGLGPKVRVNSIVPGPFKTDISDHWPADTGERHRATFALQRAGLPHEVVGAALYFASDLSSYTTGALLRIDGGAP